MYIICVYEVGESSAIINTKRASKDSRAISLALHISNVAVPHTIHMRNQPAQFQGIRSLVVSSYRQRTTTETDGVRERKKRKKKEAGLCPFLPLLSLPGQAPRGHLGGF